MRWQQARFDSANGVPCFTTTNSGGTYVPSENTGTIEVRADHTGGYEPGSTAHLLLRAPFANGHGLLLLERTHGVGHVNDLRGA